METKICTKCGKILPLENFNWRDKKKGTRRSECKFCHSDYMKNHYRQKKIEIQDLKIGLKCVKCGYNRCGASLEFHHINPNEKDDTIARMISNNYALSKVQEEVQKCVVLCSNCHHEFNFLNNNNQLFTLEEFLQED